MVLRKVIIFAVCVVSASAFEGCSRISLQPAFSARHQEPLPEGKPLCSDCHLDTPFKGAQKPYSVYNHTTYFLDEHKYTAGGDPQVCAVCHPQSFCADCHAKSVELKPSVKFGDRPDRDSMHRGDFMTRHKIEGKIDPASCYRCHGNANNAKCVTCHR